MTMPKQASLDLLDADEVTERYFRPVEGHYLDQALDRALFFLSQGLTERATIMLEVLTRLEPENPRVTLSYVEALIEYGALEEAKSELAKARFVQLSEEAALLEAIILIRLQQPKYAQLILESLLKPSAATPARVRHKARLKLRGIAREQDSP